MGSDGGDGNNPSAIDDLAYSLALRVEIGMSGVEVLRSVTHDAPTPSVSAIG